MKELDFKQIGIRIRKRRISVGKTQEQIANALDVNPSHISNIECGRVNPSLTALVNIANALACSVDAFLEDEYSFDKNAALKDDCDQAQLLIGHMQDEDRLRALQILQILAR